MKKLLISGSLFLVPTFAFAQQLSNIQRLLDSVRNIVDALIPLVAAIALLYFFWGLAKFILAASKGDEDMREKAKNVMVWGIVALFVIVSVWGLVEFVGDALDIDQDSGNRNVPGIGN